MAPEIKLCSASVYAMCYIPAKTRILKQTLMSRVWQPLTIILSLTHIANELTLKNKLL